MTEIPKTFELIDAKKLFKDLKVKSWSKSAIDYVVSRGFMNGTSSTRFEQDGEMTRAMVVSVLWRIAGSPEPEGTNPFRDLEPKQKWYHKAVVWAYENGIVSGMSKTTFEPTAPVTREQLATFMFRFAKHIGVDTTKRSDISSFPDSRKVNSWSRDALSWANAEGLITGTTERDGVTRLKPRDNATREQVATILMRFCEKFHI